MKWNLKLTTLRYLVFLSQLLHRRFLRYCRMTFYSNSLIIGVRKLTKLFNCFFRHKLFPKGINFLNNNTYTIKPKLYFRRLTRQGVKNWLKSLINLFIKPNNSKFVSCLIPATQIVEFVALPKRSSVINVQLLFFGQKRSYLSTLVWKCIKQTDRRRYFHIYGISMHWAMTLSSNR